MLSHIPLAPLRLSAHALISARVLTIATDSGFYGVFPPVVEPWLLYVPLIGLGFVCTGERCPVRRADRGICECAVSGATNGVS